MIGVVDGCLVADGSQKCVTLMKVLGDSFVDGDEKDDDGVENDDVNYD